MAPGIRAVAVAGLVAVAPVTAAAAAPVTITPGTLTVCAYPAFAPFSSMDASGAWVGWDATFLTRFAQQQGLTVTTVSISPFAGIWKRPGTGECDIAAAGIGDQPGRRSASPGTTWSIPYYSVIRAFAVRRGTTLAGPQDLAGKVVIVTPGSAAHQDLRQQIRQHHVKGVTIRYTHRGCRAVGLVARGKAFAYGGGLGSIQYHAARYRNVTVAWPHRILLPDGRTGTEPFAYPVRTADTGLVAALNAFIAANRASYGRRATEGGRTPDEQAGGCPSY